MFNKTTSTEPRRESFSKKFLSKVPDLRTAKQRLEDERAIDEAVVEAQRDLQDWQQRQDAKLRRAS
jgi:hypothetical protein